MQERQFIYREIPKDNERQKNIFLTREGKQIVSQVNQIFEQLDEKVRSGLTKEEQKQLKENLLKVENHFKEQ